MTCRVRIAPLKHYEVTADAVDELKLRLEREEEGVRAVGHEHEECRREDHGLELRELLRADSGARHNNRTRRRTPTTHSATKNTTQRNKTQRNAQHGAILNTALVCSGLQTARTDDTVAEDAEGRPEGWAAIEQPESSAARGQDPGPRPNTHPDSNATPPLDGQARWGPPPPAPPRSSPPGWTARRRRGERDPPTSPNGRSSRTPPAERGGRATRRRGGDDALAPPHRRVSVGGSVPHNQSSTIVARARRRRHPAWRRRGLDAREGTSRREQGNLLIRILILEED